jgi:7-cyano-7-deazaguanine synthase
VDADPTRHHARPWCLVSGGLDSATVLAMAAAPRATAVTRLAFDYGQRHRSELAAAAQLSHTMAVPWRTKWWHWIISTHRRLRADRPSNIAVPTHAQQKAYRPPTSRRATRCFCRLPWAWAEVLQARDIFIGVNAVDYSGYPDCRPAYIEAFQTLANLATKAGVEGRTITIHAPLLQLTKAAIIQQGVQLNVNYAQTVSCYQADSTGAACGACDSCRLRREGFQQAGVADPTRYQ